MSVAYILRHSLLEIVIFCGSPLFAVIAYGIFVLNFAQITQRDI